MTREQMLEVQKIIEEIAKLEEEIAQLEKLPFRRRVYLVAKVLENLLSGGNFRRQLLEVCQHAAMVISMVVQKQ